MSQRALLEAAEMLVLDVSAVDRLSRLAARPPPTGWAPATLAAARDLLARGLTERLVRWGAGRRFVAREGARTMFEHPDARLVFGDATLDLIGWLASEPHPRGAPLTVRAPWTPADELLLVRALGIGDLSPIPAPGPHAWLLAGRQLALAHEPTFDAGRLAPWLVEALQPALTRAWVAWAREARLAADPELVIRHGEAQDRVLSAFLAWADAIERPELALFLLDALRVLAELPDGAWAVQPTADATLARRRAARRAAVAVPRAVITVQTWVRRWSRVGWLDDDHDRAQWRLRQFELASGLAERFAPLLSASEGLT